MRLLSKLSGHNDSVLCCEFSPSTTLLATGSEDGTCSVFDMRLLEQVQKNDLNHKPLPQEGGRSSGKRDVSAVLFLPHEEHILLAAAGSSIFTLDLRQLSDPVREYTFNSDEITAVSKLADISFTGPLQMSVNGRGSFLAAADDSGEVKICSCVQFHPTRPWEVITGGLDSKVIKWDFSRGRPRHVWDMGAPSSTGEGVPITRLYNPPLVHGLAVLPPDASRGSGQNVFAAARGDCVVSIFDLDAHKNEGGGGRGQGMGMGMGVRRGRGRGRGRGRRMGGRGGGEEMDSAERRMERHKATVSHLTFSKFSASPQFLVSGGNDRQIAIWEWGRAECGEKESGVENVDIGKSGKSGKSGKIGGIVENFEKGNDGEDDESGRTDEECQSGGFEQSRKKCIDDIQGDGEEESEDREETALVTDHGKKVNWLATRASDQGNLCVADTSKRITIYQVA